MPKIFFVKTWGFLTLLTLIGFFANAQKIALTLDDPGMALENNPISLKKRTEEILKILKKHDLKIIVFVTGKRLDNQQGKEVLRMWQDAGHILANHSYSHGNYNSKGLSYKDFKNDILKNEIFLSEFQNFQKFFRYPFLKEGNTTSKRDRLRKFLEETNYKPGYVTIDTSDWYIDKRLRNKLSQNSNPNFLDYKSYYLNHMWERAQYYETLRKNLNQKSMPHILLTHDLLITSYFLDDLIGFFKNKGWQWLNADEAYELGQPYISKNLPAGESLYWSMANDSKKLKPSLRYPAEDGEYEKIKMIQNNL